MKRVWVLFLPWEEVSFDDDFDIIRRMYSNNHRAQSLRFEGHAKGNEPLQSPKKEAKLQKSRWSKRTKTESLVKDFDEITSKNGSSVMMLTPTDEMNDMKALSTSDIFMDICSANDSSANSSAPMEVSKTKTYSSLSEEDMGDSLGAFEEVKKLYDSLATSRRDKRLKKGRSAKLSPSKKSSSRSIKDKTDALALEEVAKLYDGMSTSGAFEEDIASRKSKRTMPPVAAEKLTPKTLPLLLTKEMAYSLIFEEAKNNDRMTTPVASEEDIKLKKNTSGITPAATKESKPTKPFSLSRKGKDDSLAFQEAKRIYDSKSARSKIKAKSRTSEKNKTSKKPKRKTGNDVHADRDDRYDSEDESRDPRHYAQSQRPLQRDNASQLEIRVSERPYVIKAIKKSKVQEHQINRSGEEKSP